MSRRGIYIHVYFHSLTRSEWTRRGNKIRANHIGGYGAFPANLLRSHQMFWRPIAVVNPRSGKVRGGGAKNERFRVLRVCFLPLTYFGVTVFLFFLRPVFFFISFRRRQNDSILQGRTAQVPPENTRLHYSFVLPWSLSASYFYRRHTWPKFRVTHYSEIYRIKKKEKKTRLYYPAHPTPRPSSPFSIVSFRCKYNVLYYLHIYTYGDHVLLLMYMVYLHV